MNGTEKHLSDFTSCKRTLPATWIGLTKINDIENHIIKLPDGRERHLTRYMLGEYIKNHQIFLTNSTFGFKADGTLWLSVEDEQKTAEVDKAKNEKHTPKVTIKQKREEARKEKAERERAYNVTITDHRDVKHDSVKEFAEYYGLNYTKIRNIFDKVMKSRTPGTVQIKSFTVDEVKKILTTPTLYNSFKHSSMLYYDHEFNIFPTKTAMFDYWGITHERRQQLVNWYFSDLEEGTVTNTQIDGYFKDIWGPKNPEKFSHMLRPIWNDNISKEWTKAHYDTVIGFMKMNVKDKSKLRKLGII